MCLFINSKAGKILSNIDFDKLKVIQKKLASKVKQELPENFHLSIATGLDISYQKNSDQAVAMAVSYDVKNKKICEEKYKKFRISFPYVSGFLAFREVPFYLRILKLLENPIDLLLVDGFGILHPRKLGSAAHLGVLTNTPTIGVGKSKFVGNVNTQPNTPGEWIPIIYKNKQLGALLKPNMGKNIYISVGNLIDLKSAVKISYDLIMPNKRLPEPLFLADRDSKELVNEIL
ncbi:MAG: hypothetical protein GF329_15065 [Candidatus Lokiarchaeota archaeon]|nr:hypothetical protein [Candidatus Lokiarchaeota archaeon]